MKLHLFRFESSGDKSHSFLFIAINFSITASTVDIPSRWDPQAKQSRSVALLAALRAAALFEPFHRVDKKKNQNTNVFWFFLVRVVIQNFSKTIVVQFVFEVIG